MTGPAAGYHLARGPQTIGRFWFVSVNLPTLFVCAMALHCSLRRMHNNGEPHKITLKMYPSCRLIVPRFIS